MNNANNAAEREHNEHLKKRLYELNEAAAWFFKQNLQGEPFNYCLRVRQMTQKVIEMFEIGYAQDHWTSLYAFLIKNGFSESEIEVSKLCVRGKNGSLHDFFRDRVMFPIRNLEGRVIAFGGRIWKKDDERPKYVNTAETLIFHKGSALYGLFRVPKPPTDIIVCEGYMDAIALQSKGFVNAVAGLGTALTLRQCLLIQSYTENVYLLYDKDLAGLEATKKAIENFEEIGVSPKIVFMQNAKDADEYLKKYPVEQFIEEVLNQAKNHFEFDLKYNQIKYGSSPSILYQKNLNTVLGELKKI